MPQCSTDSSLVSTVLTPVRLDSGSLVVHDETGYRNRVDLEELNYTNRELVNLENAAVNIENSTGVTIGPLTQFNVNGNVTIYQNGQENNEAEDGKTSEPTQETGNAQLPKNEKFSYFDPKHLVKRKALKLLIAAIIAVALLTAATVILLHIFKSEANSSDNLIDEVANPTHIGTSNHNLLSKKEWGGRPAKNETAITRPVKMVVIKHTGGSTCLDFQKCAGIAQTIQSVNVASGLPDIYCNFMVGGDGNVYVGRGFDAQPQYHVDMYDVVFFGNFDFDVPTNDSLDAAKFFLEYAVKRNKLAKDYKVVNHNQTFPTQSPGINLIREIKKFPHYDPGNYFSQPLDTPDIYHVQFVAFYVEEVVFHVTCSSLAGTPGGSFHRFLTIVYLNQKFIRNLLIFVIIFLVVIIVIIVICTINFEKLDKNFNETIYSTNIGSHKVFYRKDWKGVPPKMQVFLTEPAEFVVISHSQTSSCHNSETCMNQLRVLQKHCISLGYLDVGYNFFIGSSSDDNIYVGRGWDTVSILGNRSISIQIIGNFAFDRFEENTIDAVKLLIEEGVQLKKISEDYKLIGENQTTLYKFLSPGINVYKVIKQWPHFYNGIVFGTSFQTQ